MGFTPFSFKPVDHAMVKKSIKKINSKKATGVHQLPAKLIKGGSPAFAVPISTIFNMSARNSQFSDDLKNAQICPIKKRMIPL